MLRDIVVGLGAVLNFVELLFLLLLLLLLVAAVPLEIIKFLSGLL